MSAIERGKHLPNLANAISLCRVLNCDPTQLFDRVHAAVLPLEISELKQSLAEQKQSAIDALWRGDPRTALAVYDAYIVRIEHEIDDELVIRKETARAEVGRAVVLRRLGAVESSRAAAEQAVRLSEATPDVQAEAYTVLSQVYLEKGNIPLAVDNAERAIERSSTGNPNVRGLALAHRGTLEYVCGDKVNARDLYEKARLSFLKFLDNTKDSTDIRVFSERRGVRHQLVSVVGSLGTCYLDLGQKKAGRDRFNKAIKLADDLGDARARSLWRLARALLCFDEGDLDEADRDAEKALFLAKESDDELMVFRAEWRRHCIRLRREPQALDSRRIRRLRDTYYRFKNQQWLDEIKDFGKRYTRTDGNID